MNHYETLGVAKDATPEQIRKAYRKKAAKAHPDRHGGSDEAMTALNRANDCLSDPERRAHYDETGDDTAKTPLQAKAVAMVIKYFDLALENGVHKNIVATIRRKLKEAQGQLERELRSIAAARAKLLESRGKVRVRQGKETPNYFQSLIDKRIEALDLGAKEGEEMMETMHAAFLLFDVFEEDAEVELPGEAKGGGSIMETLMDIMEKEARQKRGSPFNYYFSTPRGAR